MRYFIKINEVGEKIYFMEKKLDIIHDNIERLKIMKDELSWKGDAANDFYNIYDNYLSKLRIYEQKTINSVLFLASFYNKYGEEYTRLKRKYATIIDMEV